MTQTTLIERYQTVIAHIKQLSHQYRQDETAVQLIAVSKTFPSADIRTLYQQGQRHFGENYIQEWSQKTDELADLDIIWHIIGQVQSNKSRTVAEKAAWVHTIDREKIAKRLSELLDQNIEIADNWRDVKPTPKAGQVVMLQNVRVNVGEKANDPELGKAYAALCDVFEIGRAHV